MQKNFDNPPNQFDSSKATAAVNQEMKRLFEIPDDMDKSDQAALEYQLLEGKEPKQKEIFSSGEKNFGAEFYLPAKDQPPKVWVIAQHGYGGRARDFSKLAEILNDKDIGLLSLDMHTEGQDDFERMSMKIDEWSRAALDATKLLQNFLEKHGLSKSDLKDLIFLGQSSGGTSGAEILTKNKDDQPFTKALLISPTLTTANPELIKAMNEIVDANVPSDQDVMLDYSWLAPLMHQLHDEKLDTAYQAHLQNQPGFPYRHAYEAIAIDPTRLIYHLNSVDIPTIIAKGEFDTEDTVSLPTAAKSLAEQPNDNITIGTDIKNAGHQAHIEQPEMVADLIEKLISK